MYGTVYICISYKGLDAHSRNINTESHKKVFTRLRELSPNKDKEYRNLGKFF